jgi:hypothetical protein
MSAMFILSGVSVLALSQAAPVDPGPDRGAVVAALAHHEGLVKTLRVDYEHTMLATPPEQAEQIKRALGKKAEASLFTSEFAKGHSGSARFWRKGGKQRDEWLPLGSTDPQGQTTRAFDGQILRSVEKQGREGRPVAVIATAKTGDWHSAPREDPMAFLYLYYERPLSEVIASASTFSSEVITRGKQRLYRVAIRCAWPSNHVLEFLFDERFLQQERLLKVWRARKRDAPVHNHKLVFTDYRAFETSSGEKVWFPDTVTYVGYSMDGTALDGSPLEILWKKFRFTNVQFNIDMPDSLFELEIPKNAQINDMVTGAGWLSPGQRPATLFPAEAWTKRLWVGAVVIAALALVTAAVFYRRRWRSAAAGG